MRSRDIRTIFYFVSYFNLLQCDNARGTFFGADAASDAEISVDFGIDTFWNSNGFFRTDFHTTSTGYAIPGADGCFSFCHNIYPPVLYQYRGENFFIL